MVDPRPKRKATYQDILDAPEHMVAEVVSGELHLSPRPGVPHTRAASRLGGVLIPPFDMGSGGPGGWVILNEPELHIADGDVLVPDLAGWRADRLQMTRGAAITTTPDWV